MKLAIVTATLDLARAAECITSWTTRGLRLSGLYVVAQQSTVERGVFAGTLILAPEILGVVPAFALGVQKALEDGAEIIACLHDDLLIEQPAWDLLVCRAFQEHPEIGLVGFGGALGLGDDDLYQTPYRPHQLARKDFISNMRDAEAHGRRVTTATRVSCLDGFSQIGRREFWEGRLQSGRLADPKDHIYKRNLFTQMQEWGVVHHFYDSMLGCFAARLGWETWMLPIACHHFGGRTAVGDARYQAWARLQKTGTTEGECGDAGFWQQAHRIGYDQFRDVLPLRVPSTR